MDLDRTPAAIATAAGEELRQLNHATLKPNAYPHPGDVADTVTALTELLERMPQALQQAEAGLVQLQDDNAIRLDDRPQKAVSQQELTHAVFTVINAMQETRARLGEAATELRKAAGPLSSMGGPWPDDEGAGEAQERA